MNSIVCTSCEEPKTPEEMTWKNKAKGKMHPKCKSCVRESSKAHYHANKTKYLQRNKEQRKVVAGFIRTQKEIPCKDCGKTYPYYVMDFDHVRGTKTALVSKLHNSTIKRASEEIAKCDVVCSNCHRVRTHARK